MQILDSEGEVIKSIKLKDLDLDVLGDKIVLKELSKKEEIGQKQPKDAHNTKYYAEQEIKTEKT
jgi:hypothetical protein